MADRPRRCRGRRVWSLCVSAVLAALVLTGCTVDVAGLPTPAPSASDTPDVGADVELAPGVIPPPHGAGRQLEAHRLAGTTTIALAVFPERDRFCSSYGPFVAAVDLERAYSTQGTIAPILDRYGFVAAWGTCAADASGQVTFTASVELSDPVSAVQAVAEVEATGEFVQQGSVLGGAPLLVRSDGGLETVAIWAPVGRMVAFALHMAPAGQAVPEATRLITEQVGLLGTFEPTPQAEVPNLPADPNGLAGLTVDPPAKTTPQPATGPYDLESFLRLSPRPLDDRGLLVANGFVGAFVKLGSDGSLIYDVELLAFPGPAQANAVYAAYAGRQGEIFGGGVFMLPAVPEASCIGGDLGTPAAPAPIQHCDLLVGNHLASVTLLGLPSLDGVTAMDALLSTQRDLLA